MTLRMVRTRAAGMLAAGAIAGGTVAAGAAAAPTVFTDEVAFAAAAGGVTSFSFGFSGTEFLGTTYTLGPVTFASAELQSYHDAYGSPSVAYLASYGPALSLTSTAHALGLRLGSFDGLQTVTYRFDGTTGSFDVPRRDATAFIGFVDTGPISIALSNDGELDTISLSSGTVPEPASWVLLVAGFGLVGIAVRQRAARATPE